MKNLITIILLVMTTSLFAQKQDSTIQPISIPIQYAVEDTVNHKVYTFVLAQLKDKEWVFQYSADWKITNKEVNIKLSSYKPLIITYDLTSQGSWKFTSVEGLIDADTIFADMIVAIMYPYLRSIESTINKKQ